MQSTAFDIQTIHGSALSSAVVSRVDAWRCQVTSALLQMVLLTGLLALFASPVWSYEQENVRGLLAATGLFVVVSGTLFLTRKRLSVNAGLLLVLAYLSVASLLISVVPGSLPYQGALAMIAVAAMLLNHRVTALLGLVGLVALLAVNGGYWFVALEPRHRPEVPVEWWLVCGFCIVVLSVVVALPQRRMLDQIYKVLEQVEADKHAIRQSELRFLTIFNSVSDAIFIHDIDTGRILDVNDAMCRTWRCTRDYALSVASINELSLGQSPYSEVEARDWMRKAAMGEACSFEWYCRDTKGQLFWMEMSIRRARLGDKDRPVVSGRNINDRVQAQRALQQQLAVQRMAIVFSARILTATSRSFNDAINNLLQSIGRHFGVEAVSIARVKPDAPAYQLSHLWMAESYAPFFDLHEPVPLGDVPWAASVLMKGGARRMNDLSDLPAAHAVELNVLRRKGIRAVLAVPLRGSESDMIGSLCINSLTSPRQWTDQEEGQMQLLAGLLAAAIESQRAQDAIRDSEERSRLTAEANGRLLAEVNHRVRNNLASILSLVTLSDNKTGDLASYIATLQSRIGAMARTHDLLSQSNWQPVALSELCRQLWDLMGSGVVDSGRVNISGPDVMIPPRTAGSFALALQELVTNAFKHGALRDNTGSVELTWSSRDGVLTVLWSEHCDRPIASPDLSGAGTQLLEGLIQYDLRGTIQMDFGVDGLRCTITVPLEA